MEGGAEWVSERVVTGIVAVLAGTDADSESLTFARVLRCTIPHILDKAEGTSGAAGSSTAGGARKAREVSLRLVRSECIPRIDYSVCVCVCVCVCVQ